MCWKVSSPPGESVITGFPLRALGTANSPHVRLFDCLRAISGNQVLDGQELPCNNYGVKWQLATQEGICLLAAPSCSAGVRGHRLFRKSPFLKHPETGGGPDSPVYLKSAGENGKDQTNLHALVRIRFLFWGDFLFLAA